MKQRMTRVIVVAVLTALVIAVFAACGRDNGDGGTQVDFNRTSWTEPFPETVTFTTAWGTFDANRFLEGDETHTDTIWTRRWLEEFNIQAEVEWVSEDYQLQLNLSIAAGDIPDIFRVYPVQFAQLLEANLIEDITDVTNQWLSPRLAELYEREHLVFDTATRDGSTYALPMLSAGMTAQIPHLWVRKDWYQQAGSPEIRTVADLEALMETFMENNGATLGTTLYDRISGVWRSASMFHAFPRSADIGNLMWLDDGAGGLVSGFEMPEMLDLLSWWRDLYARGLVQDDFATNDWNSLIASILNGETGIVFGQNWLHWQILATIEANGPDSYFLSLPMPTVDGRPAQHPVEFRNYAYHVVRRGFEHPEILPILNSDYIYIFHEAPFTDSIDQDLLIRFTDAHWIAGPVRVVMPHWDDILDVFNYLAARDRGDTYEARTPQGITFIAETLLWADNQDVTGLGRFSQNANEYAALVRGMRAQENGQFLHNGAWGPDPQEVLDLRAMTNDIMMEGMTRIIMGVEPLEHWHVLLEEWRQAGGNRMTEAINRDFR